MLYTAVRGGFWFERPCYRPRRHALMVKKKRIDDHRLHHTLYYTYKRERDRDES
jgi:hypothetical protein